MGQRLRRLNSQLHRDVGYFLSGLILVYAISGLALNHVDDWNPDFVVQKRSVEFGRTFSRQDVDARLIAELTAEVGEGPARLHDFPTPGHVKIYYDNASLLVDLPAGSGLYESVRRRGLFYETNVLHRNSLRGWKWVADGVSVLMIFLTVSGWFMLKGKNGLTGRGVWFIAVGILPPVVAVLLFELVQK